MEFVFENNNRGLGSEATSMSMGSADSFIRPQSPITQSTTTRRSTRRNLPSSIDEIEITDTRKRTRRAASAPKVNYVKTAKKAKREASFEWTWQKFWWMVALVAFLRLLLMENGVIDYYKVESSIENNLADLSLIKEENAQLVTEIHQIQTSPKYQKKLARDHLGVIAQDEYLILFAKD